MIKGYSAVLFGYKKTRAGYAVCGSPNPVNAYGGNKHPEAISVNAFLPE